MASLDKSLELLAEAYKNSSSQYESPLDLIFSAISTFNALRGSKIDIDSAAALIAVYGDKSDLDKSVSDLKEATCATIKTLRRARRSVDDAVLLIDNYRFKSGSEESASTLRDATCKTLQILVGTQIDASSIPRIMNIYGHDQPAPVCAEQVCDVIKSLNKNGVSFSNAVDLMMTYKVQFDGSESLSDLIYVTSKTLDYLISNKIDVDSSIKIMKHFKYLLENKMDLWNVFNVEDIKNRHLPFFRRSYLAEEKQRYASEKLCPATIYELYSVVCNGNVLF